MTQGEVQKLLKESDKPMSVAEIAKKLNKGQSSINKNIKVLFEKEEIKRKSIRKKHYIINLYFI